MRHRLSVSRSPVGHVLLLALCGLLIAPCRGATQEAPGFHPIPIDTFSLDNGLRVILSEDHSAPLVATSLWYQVGSAHEPPGLSGFVHLFEHMYFGATQNLGVGASERLVYETGGGWAAATNSDRLALSETWPARYLERALWLLAERMDRLVIDDVSYADHRLRVREEWRGEFQDQPHALAQLVLDTLAQDYRPYRHGVIDAGADLAVSDAGDAEDFYRRYLVPANAVLTVVGDVDAGDLRRLTESHLGPIDAGSRVAELPEPPASPRQDGERRVELTDPPAQFGLVWTGFSVPPSRHADRYALELIAEVLGGGEGSRIHRRLVEEEAVAVDVVALLDTRKGTGTLRLGALVSQGVSEDRVEALLNDEVARLSESGVDDVEFRRARNARRLVMISERMSVEAKAEALQWYALHLGSPFEINAEPDRYEAVTAADLQRVARRYLVPANRAVVLTRANTPTGGAGR